MISSLIILLFIVDIDNSFCQKCEKIDACSCRFDHSVDSVDEGIINLHKISEDGEPITVDPQTYREAFFYYSPCSAYPCPTMKDSVICLMPLPSSKSNFQDFGDLNGVNFYTNTSVKNKLPLVSLIYKATDTNITSQVNLICSETTEFRFEKQLNSTSYLFFLYSPCACINGCLDHGLSAGTILVIIFVVVTLLYFGIGCLYRKAVFNATGQEIIPNHQFWTSLPSLIKDGYLFFISPCLGDRANYRVYDQL